jgi:hypothetical protein
MVSVPVSTLALLLELTENDTVPLPVPDAPEVTNIQLAMLLAFQPQPAGAITFTLPLPPLEPNEADVADSEYEQPTPASLLLKVCPSFVSEPVWSILLLFSFTVYDTVPLPLPLVPAEICTNPALLFALQLQPAGAITFTPPAPPTAPKEALVADNE